MVFVQLWGVAWYLYMLSTIWEVDKTSDNAVSQETNALPLNAIYNPKWSEQSLHFIVDQPAR